MKKRTKLHEVEIPTTSNIELNTSVKYNNHNESILQKKADVENTIHDKEYKELNETTNTSTTIEEIYHNNDDNIILYHAPI